MKKLLQSKSLTLVGTALSVSIAAGCAANSTPSEIRSSVPYDVSKSAVLKSENRSYVNINPMIKFAPAYGQFSKSAHGTFGSFPANFQTPVHVHTGAYHGVVVKGVMTNPFNGEANPPQLKPGSYWYVPANMSHSTACVSDTPCEFYFHAESSFDFTPVE